MSDATPTSGGDSLEHPLNLKWTVRSGEGRLDRMAVVFSVAMVAGVVGLRFLGHPLFGVLGFAMILASTAEVWWGTRYEINAQGAKAITGVSTTSINWIDVKRVIASETELTLSPLEKDSRLAPFRGVTLRYGKLSPETVRDAVDRFGGDHVRNLG